MANKTLFSIDGSKVSKLFSDAFSYLKSTRFKVVNNENKNVANMPLYLALILGIIFPVLSVTLLIVVLVLSYKISIEQENKEEQVLIDKQ